MKTTATATRRSIAPKETLPQALHRLARLGREHGVAIYVYDEVGRPEYFATSISRPGCLHRVTLLSCDCQAFQRHQRCTHFARLLEEIGELPPVEPEAEAARAARRDEIVKARAEVARLGRNPKSTADWHNLQNAKAALWALVEADVMPRPEGTRIPAELALVA